ncbi:MAG: hypothetical protein WD768_01585 [Phycisphaeraceae bacterium]
MPDSHMKPLIPDTGHRPLRMMAWCKGVALASMVAIALGIAIGALLPEKAQIAAIVLGSSLGGVGLLIGLFMWLFGIRWQKAVNQMVAGDYYVYWTYEQQQWHDFVTKEYRKRWWVFWVIAGCTMIPGITIAAATSSDGDTIAGSIALTWLVWAGGFLLLGAGIGQFFMVMARRKYEQLLQETGDVFIGPKGFYISGDYWPWSTFGQKLEAMRTEPGPPMEIVFTFRIQQKHGSTTKDVHVPVPTGREHEWEMVMRKLGED